MAGQEPNHVYLDDRAWRFTGQFPSLDQLDAAVRWNRQAPTGKTE